MLKYILTEFSKESGLALNTDSDRADVISKINKAARELYESTDLVGCLREQVFNVDMSRLQVTLPYYVDELRNVRHYDTRSRVKVEDMRPRYFYGRDWPQKYLTWRHKNISSIGHDIENTGPLTVTLPAPEVFRFKVIFKGSTDNSDSVVETVTIEAGQLTATTVNNFTAFPGFTIIAKDRLTSQNLVITDLNGTQIAGIANCELESKYTIYAVGDFLNALNCDCYEILYKYKLSPFFNDYDVFPAPKYDDAIVAKAMSHFWSKDTSPIGPQKVLEWEMKCGAILEQRARSGEGSDEKEIQFGRNQYFDIMGYGFPTGFSSDLPARIF